MYSFPLIIEELYPRIAPYLPKQRGDGQVPNLQMLNAILYRAENACKERRLPNHFGKWHMIYTSRSLKAQVDAPPEGFSIDNTSVKAHSDGTGALPPLHRKVS